MARPLNIQKKGSSSAGLAASERSGEAANPAGAPAPGLRPSVPDPEVVARPQRRRFTAEYKRSILEQADSAQDSGAIGALLRREGLYSSHLSTWKRQRKQGELDALTPRKRGPKVVVSPLVKQNRDLQADWTLTGEERALLGNKSGATRLSFAVLLKVFQFEGRFLERREDVVVKIVSHLTSQTGVTLDAYFKEEWSERTQRHQRAQIGGLSPKRRFFRYGKLAVFRCLGWSNLSLSGPDFVGFSLKTFCFSAKLGKVGRKNKPLRIFGG